ncbi:hypothetical protein, partial [Mesorhizobium sp. M7A.F.Ca.MR.362.00.0.0]
RLREAVVAETPTISLPRALLELVSVSSDVEGLLSSMREETDTALRRRLNTQVNQDRKFLEGLAAFIDGLNTPDDDNDEQDGD